MADFTLAIPTYNGAERIPDLLEHLLSQTGLNAIDWEIIVVDNNSKDNTASIVASYQSSFSGNCTLKYVLETQQGAAFARRRAMCLAKSEWVGFLDDDVLPSEDWIAQAYAFSMEHPHVGAYGGQVHGQFEVPPPENFKRIQSFLAIRERGSQPHRYDADHLNLPPSAAWVINREAWQQHVPSQLALSGRVGSSFVQGDDYEPLMHMHRHGWEIWYNPAMHAYHQIPRQRLERDYLVALSRGCGLCVCQLRLIGVAFWRKPLIIFRLILGNLRRLVMHLFKYRWQVKTDLVAACEFSFMWACLISPFYTSMARK